MQFLKYLFWCLLAFLAAVFTFGNWTRVPVRLWSGLIADVNLPFLLLVTFLAGLVPMLLVHLTQRWRLRQRLAQTERTLDSLRQASLSPPPSALPIVADTVPAAPLAAGPALPPLAGNEPLA